MWRHPRVLRSAAEGSAAADRPRPFLRSPTTRAPRGYVRCPGQRSMPAAPLHPWKMQRGLFSGDDAGQWPFWSAHSRRLAPRPCALAADTSAARGPLEDRAAAPREAASLGTSVRVHLPGASRGGKRTPPPDRLFSKPFETDRNDAASRAHTRSCVACHRGRTNGRSSPIVFDTLVPPRRSEGVSTHPLSARHPSTPAGGVGGEPRGHARGDATSFPRLPRRLCVSCNTPPFVTTHGGGHA